MSDVPKLHASDSSVPRAALFGARFFAASPFKEVARKVSASVGQDLMRVAAAPVPCPKCGTVLAVLVRSDQHLYRPGADKDTLVGAPYSLDRRANVRLRCQPCRARFDCSGRSVARNLTDGRPPIAA